MSSMKDIKQRIANVRSTRQIIKAMDMVAATRLQKARPRLEGIRPLHGEIKQMMAGLQDCQEAWSHSFAARRKVENTAYVVMTSNRGLCGSYNTDICQKALAHMGRDKHEKIVVLGARGSDYFKRRNKRILHSITEASEAQIYENAGQLGELASSLYLSGEVDEVFVAYTYFETTLSYAPRLERVLPIFDDSHRASEQVKMRYEPDVHTFIDHLMPLYLHMYFFAALSEAATCEHAARMVSMDSAGKNATDIIDELNRMYNRKRQAAITQEINELVGGANIL